MHNGDGQSLLENVLLNPSDREKSKVWHMLTSLLFCGVFDLRKTIEVLEMFEKLGEVWEVTRLNASS